MSTRTKILLGLALVLIGIQFIRPDRTVPEFDHYDSLLSDPNIPEEVVSMLKTSCTDCHSYRTIYPWYAQIAPMSWRIQGHINHGREELNFDEWNSYSAERKIHKLEESIEMVEDKHMPMSSYVLFHEPNLNIYALKQLVENQVNNMA